MRARSHRNATGGFRFELGSNSEHEASYESDVILINNLQELGHPFRNQRFKNHQHAPAITSSRNTVRNHPIPGRPTRQVDHSFSFAMLLFVGPVRIGHVTGSSRVFLYDFGSYIGLRVKLGGFLQRVIYRCNLQ